MQMWDTPAGSEDCLNLNIYSPAVSLNPNLPIFITNVILSTPLVTVRLSQCFLPIGWKMNDSEVSLNFFKMSMFNLHFKELF